MKKLTLLQLQSLLDKTGRRLLETPQRALERAYRAALAIEALEFKHFKGGRISRQFENYGDRTLAYFQGELRKNLNIMRLSLIEFQASQPFFHPIQASRAVSDTSEQSSQSKFSREATATDLVCERLRVVEEVFARYATEANINGSSSDTGNYRNAKGLAVPDSLSFVESVGFIERIETLSDQTGIFPESILGAVRQVQKQFAPDAEVKVVQNFRSHRSQTAIALRLALMLTLVPLLTQQLSKAIVVGPIVDRMFQRESTELFLNADFKRETLQALDEFRETLQFNQLIGITPYLSTPEIDKQMRAKAQELASQSRQGGSNAIKNIFSDLIALFSFVAVLRIRQKDILSLKALMNNLTRGLSDSAKAFIIILLTDVFVGYHSPEGWEVLLEGIARHLGLASNHDLISLFIATVPVVMATIFKFWIFRYLNSISPSAVATYEEMNE